MEVLFSLCRERPPTRGKFVTVWQRLEDGAWKIHVDGFSPAGPPAG